MDEDTDNLEVNSITGNTEVLTPLFSHLDGQKTMDAVVNSYGHLFRSPWL